MEPALVPNAKLHHTRKATHPLTTTSPKPPRISVFGGESESGKKKKNKKKGENTAGAKLEVLEEDLVPTTKTI